MRRGRIRAARQRFHAHFRRNPAMTDWPLRHFRLSPTGGRGVSCSADGALVGPVPPLKRATDLSGRETWVPRSATAINADLGFCYGLPVDVASRAGGLIAIARALNDGEILRAKIAALHLQFPDLPPLTRSHEEASALAKALHQSGILKADWNPAKHPRLGGPPNAGWFAPVNSQPVTPVPLNVNTVAANDRRSECIEYCHDILERRKPYSWSDLNANAFWKCVDDCERSAGWWTLVLIQI